MKISFWLRYNTSKAFAFAIIVENEVLWMWKVWLQKVELEEGKSQKVVSEVEEGRELKRNE